MNPIEGNGPHGKSVRIAELGRTEPLFVAGIEDPQEMIAVLRPFRHR